MDLGDYAKIASLEEIMKKNNISVPRLRGLRLMSKEEPVSQADIEAEAKFVGLYMCQEACRSNFKYHPHEFTYSSSTRRLVRKYLVFDGHQPIDINWNKIHGKKRKLFKFFMKTSKHEVEKNFATFNKYCGRDDVLYIHARIGGGNWCYYGGQEIAKQPWFLEKVDDAFDSTYCDIYAKIGEPDV